MPGRGFNAETRLLPIRAASLGPTTAASAAVAVKQRTRVRSMASVLRETCCHDQIAGGERYRRLGDDNGVEPRRRYRITILDRRGQIDRPDGPGRALACGRRDRVDVDEIGPVCSRERYRALVRRGRGRPGGGRVRLRA